jgi:bacteriocin biosynthesis cyclodehydratase domain-containing protein
MSGRNHLPNKGDDTEIGCGLMSRDGAPVKIYAIGPFGGAVAKYLRTFRNDTVDGLSSSAERIRPQSRINLVASWRPIMELCEALSRESYERSCPFVPLIVESRIMRLGPVVVPGEGSCWSCWIARCRQHEHRPDRSLGLSHFYAANPLCGPTGYLEPYAMMAAVRLSQTIDRLDRGGVIGGTIWEIDMMTRVISTHVVVGVHNCRYCGLHRESSTRTIADLKQRLVSQMIVPRLD